VIEIVPGGEPFLKPGGSTGCLLLHGFTAMPGEMAWLGEDLAKRGYTVLGQRLAGHGTDPRDLARTRWHDWLISVEDGLALLRGITYQVVVIGQSMGGLIALTAAARYPMAGVVAISTPLGGLSASERVLWHLKRWWKPMIEKGVRTAPPPLEKRREADYPAYPRFPARVLLELGTLQAEMAESLPHVAVPVLLIHSHADAGVPFESMERIYERLGADDKETLALEGADHSIVRDPQRQTAFDAIGRFVKRVTEREADHPGVSEPV
jgi:carboxylesterase